MFYSRKVKLNFKLIVVYEECNKKKINYEDCHFRNKRIYRRKSDS
jgi:hypothetical protein